MSGTTSPVLKSYRCTQKSRKRQLSQNNENSFNAWCEVESFKSSCSKNESRRHEMQKNLTQESFMTTQNSQPFRARLEKKLNFSARDLNSSGFYFTDSQRNKENEENLSLNSAPTSFIDLGPFFGLPSKVQNLIFKSRGIKSLYEWQETCLQTAIKGRNLLISLPTSSGKTLVAEVLILRKILLYKKDAIFILPYVSLVQEKVRGLCTLAIDLGFVVEEYAATKGFYPPKKRKSRNTVYVATIEKANSLLECLLEEGRISELGIAVVDEVHMLSETGGRGARLESIVTKLKHFAGHMQIASMSATVGNLETLAKFLNAALFKGGFRPVPLTQYVQVENEAAVVNSEFKCEEDLLTSIESAVNPFPVIDPDGITQLVNQVIPQYSCLVFCRSRNNTEAVAKLLSKCLPKTLLEHKKAEKISLFKALKEEGSGSVCSVLRRTVPFGIAYHHSGLTDGERTMLEESFFSGTINCIVCTSTLAAGVNLPARRVIIRAPYLGKDFMTKSRYDQMIGRAGRAGLDNIGESFLICDKRDLPYVKELLLAPTENCISRLLEDDSRGLQGLLFSMMGLKLVTSIKHALELTSDTLLALQTAKLEVDLKSEVLQVLENLRKQGLLRTLREIKCSKDSKQNNDEISEIEESMDLEKNNKSTEKSTNLIENEKYGRNCEKNKPQNCAEGTEKTQDLVGNEKENQKFVQNGEEIQNSTKIKQNQQNCGENNRNCDKSCKITAEDEIIICRIGKAAIKGSVELSWSNRLYYDLIKARANLTVHSHLHLLYLVVPYDANISFNPTTFYTLYSKLKSEEAEVATVLGITDARAIKISKGSHPKQLEKSVVERFYIALLLHRLLGGESVWDVSSLFDVHRGFIQQLLTSTVSFAHSVLYFSQELEELWAFKDLLSSFTKQLSLCSYSGVDDFLNLPAVKMGRAKMMQRAGFRSLTDIAKATPEQLVQKIEHMTSRTAKQIISSAKMVILERANALQEEAQDMITELTSSS